MTDGRNVTDSAEHRICAPPQAKQVPHTRTVHGDTVADPYEWMRDKDSSDVRDYIAAQNEYCAQRTAHLDTLRHTLFDELSSRIQQTDMSVPTRMDGYWYFTRTQEGSQYAVQCRLPIRDENDWTPPQIDPMGKPGSMPGEQVVFDTNYEAQGHDFFRVGGLDISKNGRWLLYGIDTAGSERYDYRLRDLTTGEDLDELIPAVGGACMTPDAQWVFYTVLDDAWRPYAVRRHRVGTPVSDDVEVFREDDERFWLDVGVSFDEHNLVIGAGSKTTTEVLMLPVDTPEGEFRAFIPRETDVEYDVSFTRFEGAAPDGSDVPIAVVYHNARNPNFEIDVIDMRSHEPPFRLGEGMCVAEGSPYGCEQGDRVEAGAASRPITESYRNPSNPAILQGTHGLSIDGIAIHRHFVALSYRSDGLPHLATMTTSDAAEDFLVQRPWRFNEVLPPALPDDWDIAADDDDTDIDTANSATDSGIGDVHSTSDIVRSADNADNNVSLVESSDDLSGPHSTVTVSDGATADGMPGQTCRLYTIGAGGNPSYEAPRMRYSFASYTRPGELHEIDPSTGEDVLLKRATVLGDFDPRDYMERRVWITARDGEHIPVSLVWRRDLPVSDCPMFITGYGAYGSSSDPAFSVARLSLLDRGVLYAVPHVRGGGEMGRAWYEQGRRLAKKHTFEDFVDATAALQDAHLADRRRTVANGGSAGGLLMGAIANMAPERFAGVEADVPFVDALTTMLDPSLPLTVIERDEWGDPLNSKAVYDYMKSYTPYENAPQASAASTNTADAIDTADTVITPAQFPKIFITSSVNDTRVLVVEPLKWLARLQSAGVDAIARIEVEAGHGGTSGRYQQWEEVCFENAWCLSVMFDMA